MILGYFLFYCRRCGTCTRASRARVWLAPREYYSRCVRGPRGGRGGSGGSADGDAVQVVGPSTWATSGQGS